MYAVWNRTRSKLLRLFISYSAQSRSEFILFKTDAFEFVLLFTIISAILESFFHWIYLQPLIFYFWYLILKKETRFRCVWTCSIVGSNWWMQLEYVTIKSSCFFFLSTTRRCSSVPEGFHIIYEFLIWVVYRLKEIWSNATLRQQTQAFCLPWSRAGTLMYMYFSNISVTAIHLFLG